MCQDVPNLDVFFKINGTFVEVKELRCLSRIEKLLNLHNFYANFVVAQKCACANLDAFRKSAQNPPNLNIVWWNFFLKFWSLALSALSPRVHPPACGACHFTQKRERSTYISWLPYSTYLHLGFMCFITNINRTQQGYLLYIYMILKGLFTIFLFSVRSNILNRNGVW